jgi:hypothetical protein
MKRFLFLFLSIAIITIGFGLRLWHIGSPIADWHSWRQVDTAAVARNFLKFGIDPLRPRYDDLSNIQSGKDNPNGWRMVEFPIYQLISTKLFLVLHVSTIEISLRLVSIFASVGSILFLILISRRFGSKIEALATGAFFAILPYSIYYGRTILPEPLMVFLSLAAVYTSFIAFDQKNSRREILLFCSSALAALALLTKPYAVFLLLPMVIPYLSHFRFSLVYFFRLIFQLAIVGIPLLLWREWIAKYPEGIPVYTWLFNEGNMRFKPAWVRWIFIERVGKLILGTWGTIFAALGLVAKRKMQEYATIFLFALGSLLYISIIARGNIQHDYYQILLLPTLSFLAGKGFSVLFEGKGMVGFVAGKCIAIGIVPVLLFASWYDIQGFYWVNRPEIVEAGAYADKIIPKDAKVIAPYNGDTTFLYQTNRQGWPIGFEIEKKMKQGASYYITVSPTDADGETKDLASRYTVLVRNEKFAIIDLTKPKNTSAK